MKPQEVVKLVLEECAKVHYLSEGKKGEKAFSPSTIASTKWHLERAVRDCQVLDSMENSQDAFFLNRFLSGIQATDSIGWIHAIVVYLDEKSHSAITKKPKMSAEEYQAALALHYFRELVRDQLSPSEALPAIASQIQERAESGDTEFFERLGKALAEVRLNVKKRGRGIEGWIRRAWLPLCLWQCASAEEAWQILKRAARLNNLEELAAGIDSNAGQWRSFERAWRNLRVR
jgi:hypothetical protein